MSQSGRIDHHRQYAIVSDRNSGLQVYQASWDWDDSQIRYAAAETKVHTVHPLELAVGGHDGNVRQFHVVTG